MVVGVAGAVLMVVGVAGIARRVHLIARWLIRPFPSSSERRE